MGEVSRVNLHQTSWQHVFSRIIIHRSHTPHPSSFPLGPVRHFDVKPQNGFLNMPLFNYCTASINPRGRPSVNVHCCCEWVIGMEMQHTIHTKPVSFHKNKISSRHQLVYICQEPASICNRVQKKQTQNDEWKILICTIHLLKLQGHSRCRDLH